ncbi:MAG: ATP-binding protein [Ignavibacteria bacterium]|nr:ATP-binding protein [Ignavibacteria bacterium]
MLRTGHQKEDADADQYDTGLVDTSIPPNLATVNRFSPLACTLHSVSKYYPPSPGIVDVVAIDESSQCSIGVALPALFRAKKLVVVGDLKQLQPVSSLVESKLIDIAIECSVDSDDLALWVNPQSSLQSLVEYQISRAGSDTVVRLTDHHRSVPEIIEFSNTTFYQGTLRLRRTANSEGTQLKWIDIRGTEVDKVNSDEIDAVIAQIKVLLEHGILPSDIGVVTPFTYQKHELTDHFRTRGGHGVPR